MKSMSVSLQQRVNTSAFQAALVTLTTEILHENLGSCWDLALSWELREYQAEAMRLLSHPDSTCAALLIGGEFSVVNFPMGGHDEI